MSAEKSLNVPCTAVILAGGQGARFWPMSRQHRPKQFLSLTASGESLIQATARRIEPLVGAGNILIVTNDLHVAHVREHVPGGAILTEPVAKNTAASIGFAAASLAVKGDPVMIVLPADHAVRDEALLRSTLHEAVELAAREDVLVTIGIVPQSPHTGYGYIKRGASLGGSSYEVSRFFEKPNLERAQKYLESGDFFWNSGMFVWRASVILKAIQTHLPDLAMRLETIIKATGGEQASEVLLREFNAIEGVSIDFGVLEHAKNCAVIAAQPFGWNDVGSWDAWAEHFDADAEGNLLHGNVLAIESNNCIIHSQQKLTAVLGLDDIVVIDSGDALLVCPRDKVQDVRKIVDSLKRSGKTQYI